MAFENAYTAILSGDSTTVSGSTLTLSSSRGTLTFTAKASRPAWQSLGPLQLSDFHRSA